MAQYDTRHIQQADKKADRFDLTSYFWQFRHTHCLRLKVLWSLILNAESQYSPPFSEVKKYDEGDC